MTQTPRSLRWIALPVLAVIAGACRAVADAAGQPARGPCFELVRSADDAAPFSGRALVFLSRFEPEPRTWNNPARLEPVLSADFEDVAPGATLRLDASNTLAFPAPLDELAGGAYWVQAVLDVDRHAPFPGTADGNPASAPVRVELGGGRTPVVRLVLDRTIAARPPAETRTVRVVELPSERLSRFHGRPLSLRALVHLPEAWFEEPERRFPLLLDIAGFGATLAGFRSVDWPAPPIDSEDFVTVYPDPSCTFGHSGFMNSDTNGPFGDALVEELLPHLEARFRCLDEREARLLQGHSSGGWAALQLMIRYPSHFGSVWASSPDPVDFRDFLGVDLYAENANLYYDAAGRARTFCRLGGWTVNHTLEHARREAVLRGGVLEFFEALFGRPGADGRPERLFDRATGAVDPAVLTRWRRHDLSVECAARWDELGPLLEGRVLVTIADNDNFLLHGSVDRLRRRLAGLGGHLDVYTLSGDHFSQLGDPHSSRATRRLVDRFRDWRDRP
ncbi:MAG: alpha/beta hydrolase-fold protein [Planctomycetota bacterium]